jgi:hypothetical protein
MIAYGIVRYGEGFIVEAVRSNEPARVIARFDTARAAEEYAAERERVGMGLYLRSRLRGGRRRAARRVGEGDASKLAS